VIAHWRWELPLFRQSRTIPGKLLGGWQFGGIASFEDGMPFTVTSGVDRSLQGINRDRPDLLGDPRLSPDRPRSELISMYFDTIQFRLNAEGQFGNAGRNILIGPGATNFNLSLHKAFPFSESRRLVFRWELFNAFNTPQFGAPGSNVSAPANFGRILSAGAGRIMQLALKFEF
jgi:hypothetical protein